MARWASKEALRGVAMVAGAAIALHQLRYALGYGTQSGDALAAHGHGYLTGALPEIGGMLVVLLVASLASSLIARNDHPGLPNANWLTWSLVILTVYSAQEMTEGVLAAGHPSGLAALSAGHGWLALPLALLLGAVAAVVWRWLDDADRVIVDVFTTPARRRKAPLRAVAPLAPSFAIASQQGLAFGFSRRPPPYSS